MSLYGTAPRVGRIALVAAIALLLAGCAAGSSSKWAPPAEAAGFFAGLWHGLLLVVTLVVSFFTDDVGIYEVHNTGVGYNIGFVLGVLAMSGSGAKASVCGGGKRRAKDRDWDEIGRRVERNVHAKISGWVDEEDWAEVGDKIERKVKEGLRKWLDEEEKKGS